MKATELRIGNFLYYKNTKDIAIVELIHKNHFDCRDEHGSFTPNGTYEPIILTDEWFQKWGFYKDGDYWSRSIDDYNFCFKYRDWANSWGFYQEFTDSNDPKDDGMKYPISFNIEYVHHLQNLWFALLYEEIWEIEQ